MEIAMRLWAACVILSPLTILGAAVSTVHAAQGTSSVEARIASPPHTSEVMDDHAGSRVGVQLVVAGAAAALVVGAGGAAYFLRRKLGLTAYSPDATGDSGHH